MSTRDDGPNRISPATIRFALVAYLAFVVYGSLVPLDFHARPLEQALAEFGKIPYLQLGIRSRADWVANVLLFVPLSFLLAETCASGRAAVRIACYALTLAACVALAVGIEFAQIFFPARTVSQNDIAAETIGALIGIGFHATWGRPLTRWLGAQWLQEAGRPRALRLLHGYLALLVFFQLMPLDLTISLADMYAKWKEGRVVLLPFGGAPRPLDQTIYDLATDAVLWTPAGYLLAAGRGAGPWRAMVLGAAGGLVIEMLQLFVFSRVVDSTDVLLAAAGAGLGAQLCSRRGTQTTATTGRKFFPTARLATLLAWVAVLLAVFWYPFDFGLDTSLAERVRGMLRVPFASYYATSEYHALTEALRKLLFFLPLGVLWWRLAAATPAPRAVAVAGPFVFAFVAGTVEAGQLFLPHKVPDFTDWLLETAGAWSGMIAARRLSGPSRNEPTRPLPDAVIRPSKRPLVWDAVGVVALAATLIVIARTPAVPYNVRELIDPDHRVLSAFALSLLAVLTLAAPLRYADWTKRAPARSLSLPLWFAVQGVLAYALVRIGTPLESLHDIVGFPILAWPAELESLLRFQALYCALGLQIMGAALITLTLYQPRHLNLLLVWLLCALALAPLLHWAIVARAATDNLTELMRGGGGPLASISLALGALVSLSAASLLAASLAACRHRLLAVFGLCVAAPLAWWLFQAGSEPVILKYGKVFSAFQFLLSADRAHYVDGADLTARYALMWSAVVAGTATLQYPGWLRLLRAKPDPASGQGHRHGRTPARAG